MSLSDRSDDEFFDARDEIGSPGPSSLVFSESIESESKDLVDGRNSLVGDLSLDHFNENDVRLVEADDHLKDEPSEQQKNESLTLTNEPSELNIEVTTSLHENQVYTETVEDKEESVSITAEEIITGTETVNIAEILEIQSQNEVLGKEHFADGDNAANTVKKSNSLENVLPPLQAEINKNLEIDDSNRSKSAEEISNPRVESRTYNDELLIKESIIPLGHEININNLIDEKKASTLPASSPTAIRPGNLPGVEKVDLSPPSSTEHRQKPKRPPPPRPKVPPPSRPVTKSSSVRSTGKPGKPYLSAIDDGLLTPNSTVDNITSEFVEALNKDKRSPAHRSKSVPIPHPKPKSKPTSLNNSLKSNGKDDEILSSVIVRNLDTGETMPLSTAAEHVSSCLNPLALQIMSRTKEFSFVEDSLSSGHNSGNSTLTSKQQLSEEDAASIASDETGITIGGEAHKTEDHDRKPGKKRKKFKKMLGKSIIKVKTVTHDSVGKAVQKVKQSRKHGGDSLNVSSDEESTETSQSIKIKASQSNKGPYQFGKIRQVQDIAVHVGAVWSMKFSHCGRLLATSGQDNVIWVWVLSDYYSYFSDMRSKYDTKDTDTMFGVSHAPSEAEVRDSKSAQSANCSDDSDDDAPFRQVPFSSYVGHAADVLDLAWSKNYFILSSSMDKTVRLWHISRKECLCCFQHIDFVTAISFHPRDDRYFLSGSLDGKLRLWNIPEKKVALWNEISTDNASATGGALITTVNFCENGKFAVCGTYDGRCIFYDTEHLKYHTQIHVRSSRGRNNKGHKITGIESLPGEHKILVTSNDSRIRLYDLRDLSMTCKYRGLTNLSSQIKASFSHDHKYIICGSEDKCVYIWPTSVPQDMTKLSSLRRDRNDCWENVKAHNAVVTCAIFAPQPHLLIKGGFNDINLPQDMKEKSHSFLGSKKPQVLINRVLISADFNGEIKVFVT